MVPVSETPQISSTPWRREPAKVEASLAAWARSFREDDQANVSDVRMPESGMANDTVMFRLDGEALVARLAPAPGSAYPTFRTYDLGFQRRVIELVRARTKVPVPEVVHLEESDSWIDAPFMVTRVVEGFVPSDNPPYLLDSSGWFLRGTPEDWKRFETSTIDVMVHLHKIDLDDDDTAFLSSGHPGKTALGQLLESMRSYYEWAREGHTVPILERALEVLAATLPANDRCVLNWGDARPGNIIYRDFQPAAVLDWEMAGMGPPEVDLAWTTFFQRFFASLADQYGLPPVPAMFDRDGARTTYERLSGDKLDHLAWYEAFSGLRFGIILVRMSLRSTAYGMQDPYDDPNDMVMFAPLLDRLLGEI
jgi:aminoglycoside phosphotransferase (APT) family kinase protein